MGCPRQPAVLMVTGECSRQAVVSLGAGIGLGLVNSVKHESKPMCDSHCVQTATACGSLAFLKLVCLL